MRKVYVFLICLCITCQTHESRLNSKLKGHWLAVKRENKTRDTKKLDPNEPPPPPVPHGDIPLHDELFFYSHDSLEIYSLQDYWINKWDYRDDSTINLYHGSPQLFRITTGQQLQVFKSDINQWQTKGEINLVKDTLILKDKDWVIKYIQITKPVKTDFDEIVLNSSGCYGTCPIMSIIIRSDRSIFYYAEKHTKKYGIYQGKLPERLFQTMWLRFASSKNDNLKSQYVASHTDDEEIEVSFVKNDIIIKSIFDYGHQSPHAFVSAYTYLMNRIDNLTDLQKSDQVLLNSISFNYYFNHSKIEQSLLRSESFWLWSKLLKAKIIKTFPSQLNLNCVIEKQKDWVEIVNKNGYRWDVPLDYYTIILSDGKHYKVKNKALSDGRYFKIETIEGKPIILDIGVNFFTDYILNRPLQYPYSPL